MNHSKCRKQKKQTKKTKAACWGQMEKTVARESR